MKLNRDLTIGVLALCASISVNAQYISTTTVGAGNSWTGAYWQLPPSTTLVAPPAQAAGFTFALVSNGTAFGNSQGNTRTRNPAVSGIQTFPGDSLTLNTNTEIRMKNNGSILNFPGANGNPGLILNGGIINVGDDGNFPITGLIQVTAQSYLCPGNNGGGGLSANPRSMDIQGQLTGTGTLVIFEADTRNPQKVSGGSNTFSGQWVVKNGLLLGAGTNSLGTNSITVDPQYALPVPPLSSTAPVVDVGPLAIATNFPQLEVDYDLNSAGVLTLANGGQFKLHQNVCFTAVSIEGTALTPGTHFFAELNASHPANFPAGGSGSITVEPYGTPPAFGQNLIINGDFKANASEFTTWPGYTGGADASEITDWVIATGSGLGVNGAAVSFAGSPFGPASDGGLTYLFIQGHGTELSQDLPDAYTPGTAYQLSFDAAARSGNNGVTFQVQIADNSQQHFTTQINGVDLAGNPAGFTTYTYLFTAPSTFDGTPSIQLYNTSTSGDNTVDFTDVSLELADSAVLITQQPAPAAASLVAGGTASFTALATGIGTISYHWRHDGTNLTDGAEFSGTTTPTLVITGLSPSDAGSYYLVATIGLNSVTSQTATLAVSTLLVTQPMTPTAMELYAGGTASFTFVAEGNGTTSYQWRMDGSNLSDGVQFSGTATTNLVITNLSAAEVRSFDVVASVAAGSVTSQVATLTTVSLPSAGTYAAAVMRQNPMGYWRFSDGGGTNGFDYIAGNNVVDPLGSPLQAGPRPPEFGGFESTNTAPHMNGTNQGYVSTSQMFNGLSEFTLMGWFNIDPDHYPLTNNAAGRASLFGQQWTAELSFYEGTNLYFYSAGIDATIFVTNGFDPGVWHFLAAVSDPSAGATTVYLDGVAAGVGGACPGTTQPYYFSIGKNVSNFPTVWSGFPGSIDEVAAFNHALSASAIQTIYLSGAGLGLNIAPQAGGLVRITWARGHLESATAPGGPWHAESTASSPWNVAPAGAMKFYRAVWP